MKKLPDLKCLIYIMLKEHLMKDRGLLKLASFFVQAIFVTLIVPIDLNFMEMA